MFEESLFNLQMGEDKSHLLNLDAWRIIVSYLSIQDRIRMERGVCRCFFLVLLYYLTRESIFLWHFCWRGRKYLFVWMLILLSVPCAGFWQRCVDVNGTFNNESNQVLLALDSTVMPNLAMLPTGVWYSVSQMRFWQKKKQTTPKNFGSEKI